MYSTSYFAVCFPLWVLLSFSSLGFAQEAGPQHQQDTPGRAGQAFLGLGDGITSCPVTGETLTKKKVSAVIFGRTVFFCCQDCLAKAQKYPELYVRRDIDGTSVGENLTKKKFLGLGDGVSACPVTGEPIDEDAKVEVNGRIIYACCRKCVDQIKKDPDLYLNPQKGEESGETGFLGKGDGITSCPVTGEAVDNDTYIEINGKTIYACCPGCIEKIKKRPSLYLKKN